MKTVIPLFIFFFTILKVEAQEISYLKIKQAFKYETSKNVPEFSGLSLKEGILYSINDKDKNYLYKFRVDTNNSTLFIADTTLISKNKDFEGICYYRNYFFVVEEKECRLYKILNNKATAYGREFLTTLKAEKLIDEGEERNKQIESFAMLSDSTFLIATERGTTTLAKINDRGKILSKLKIPDLHFSDTCLPTMLVKKSISIKDPNSLKDANSFSDLCIYGSKAYLLERKKKMIHVIDISQASFIITKTLSFKNDIMPCDEEHDFYGSAEGLAIDDKYIYIILDNNGYSEDLDEEGKCDKKRRTLFQFYNN